MIPKALSAILPLVLGCALAGAQTPSGEPLRPQWCRELPRPEYAKLERADVNDDWFEVYRIRPGVFAIYEPHQFEEVISYLILGSKRALLFDTGLGIGKISDITASLTKLPITVLNSHTHFDHTGGNAEFSDILDEDTPFTRTNEKGQSNIYSRDALAPDRICGHLPPGVQPNSYSIRPFHVAHRVTDGEHIQLGNRELEIIFTPGHTPDSLCLLDRKNGLLFTGDTFYPGPIYLFTPETDFDAYTKSVARLAKLAPKLKLLLPAHNVPVAAPDYLDRLEKAVAQVRSGAVQPVVTEGRREFSFQGFSLLLAIN
ncbi:MAG: MBL fold metallo-hydrolase [Acidobacteriia bacterium]|nr:MBL fold metallo-hydrolase [Terriglobia bacterium]